MSAGTVHAARHPYAESKTEVALEWQDDALCAETDPDAFFVEKGGNPRPAINLCGSCDVAAQCLAYALQNPEIAGIWGGTTQRTRRKMRKAALA